MSKFALAQPMRLADFAHLATNFICETCVIISTSGGRAPQALIADLRPGLVFTHGSLGGVALANAALHPGLGAVDLGCFPRLRLPKNGEKDDAAASRDKVADPAFLSTDVKAQFPKLAAKLARIGLAQERIPISQQVDVESAWPKSSAESSCNQPATSGCSSILPRVIAILL
jgi:hypothetical protein